MGESLQRNAESPPIKLFDLLQCPFQPFPPAHLSPPRPLPLDTRAPLLIPTPPSVTISSRIPSSFFSPLLALPYPPFCYRHFIGGCYIIHAQWMWTKRLSVSVRYEKWNIAHNLYSPLLFLFVFSRCFFLFSSSLTFTAQHPLSHCITCRLIPPFSSQDYSFFFL